MNLTKHNKMFNIKSLQRQ